MQPARLARLTQAFELGSGDGLVQLGGAELEGELPPALGWFREFGHRFFTALCALPDLDLPGTLKAAPASPDFDELARSAAPMLGGEYLNAQVLEALWGSLWDALAARAKQRQESVIEVVRGLSPVWHGVGRVVFHLAENKRDSDHPFAFLATYTTRLTRAAKAQHVPLGEAVRESGGAKQRQTLLALLVPVQRAAEKSELVRQLVDSGDLYHPLAWTPPEAYRFLRELPAIEQSGVLVRVPDWWSSRQRGRAVVLVSVGKKPPSTLGLDALLDFSVEVALDGETLSVEEWRAITRAEAGLSMVRGRWVEIDPERLTQALEHWQKVAKDAKDGMSLLEAMRLLAGTAGNQERDEDAVASAPWTGVRAGEWLTQTLRALREPEASVATDPRDGLRAELRPYQRAGVEWLRLLGGLGLGACLADDMGLGKTVQVLGLLLRDRRERKNAGKRPSLLIVPASLIGNGQAEIARFAPTLVVRVAHASVAPLQEVKLALDREAAEIDLVITSYGGAQRLGVRGGAVVHLGLESGRILAKVQGSSLYDIEIGVAKLEPKRWSSVVAQCTGNIDSLVELLRGKISDSVMRAVTNAQTGLFPRASEIEMSCSCPDFAGLCKHLAAVLYGVGARLDTRPELLFTLRGVDPNELVGERVAALPKAQSEGKSARRVLPSSALSDVFGIEFERAPTPLVAKESAPARRVERAKPKAELGAKSAPKRGGAGKRQA